MLSSKPGASVGVMNMPGRQTSADKKPEVKKIDSKVPSKAKVGGLMNMPDTRKASPQKKETSLDKAKSKLPAGVGIMSVPAQKKSTEVKKQDNKSKSPAKTSAGIG